MIDIHCHILPIYDGPKDIEEAIQMAQIAERDGIKKIINTSHFSPQYDDISKEEQEYEINKLNEILKKNNIDVEILIGNEIYYNDNVLKDINNNIKKFHTLNNSEYILLEFPVTGFPHNICEIIYEFKLKGYKVILAHVERYIEIQQNPQLIEKAIEEGAYIQVNASTILKRASKDGIKLVEKLLQKNQVHIIASDAHGPNNRRPKLKEAYEYIKEEYGQENAQILFEQNPKNIINNIELITMQENQQTNQKTNIFHKLLKVIKG